MRKNFYKFSCVCVAVFLIAGPGVHSQPRDSPDPLGGLFIVEAIVKEVKMQPERYTICTLTIQQVYSGPKELKGQTFQLLTGDGPSNGELVGPPLLALDEQGIWPLRRNDSGALEYGPRRATNGYLPARNIATTRYVEAVAVAQLIGRIAASADARRIEELKAAALNETPEVAAWAASFLGLLATDQSPSAMNQKTTAIKIVHGLRQSEKLCAAAAASLDEIDFDEQLNDDKDVRVKMFMHSVSRKMSDYDVQRLRRWLATTATTGNAELADADLFRILDAAFTYMPHDVKEPDRAILLASIGDELFGDDLFSGRDLKGIFMFLVRQIDTSKDSAIRIAAARRLPTPQSEDQQVILEHCIANEKNHVVADEMSKALNRMKGT